VGEGVLRAYGFRRRWTKRRNSRELPGRTSPRREAVAGTPLRWRKPCSLSADLSQRSPSSSQRPGGRCSGAPTRTGFADEPNAAAAGRELHRQQRLRLRLRVRAPALRDPAAAEAGRRRRGDRAGRRDRRRRSRARHRRHERGVVRQGHRHLQRGRERRNGAGQRQYSNATAPRRRRRMGSRDWSRSREQHGCHARASRIGAELWLRAQLRRHGRHERRAENSDFVASGGGPRDGTNYPTGQARRLPEGCDGCPQDNLVNDMIDVKLVLKAPPDATGSRYDFDSTRAMAQLRWLQLQATRSSRTYLVGDDRHISFDCERQPVAVNIDSSTVHAARRRCLRSNGPNADPPLPPATCSAGPSELDAPVGDTYETSATATRAGDARRLDRVADDQLGHPARDSSPWSHDLGRGRRLLDSSVLIDHFQWIGGRSPPRRRSVQ